MIDRPRLIVPEIAQRYGRSEHTVAKEWRPHPAWPAPVGKRGRWLEYDEQDVVDFVAQHVDRPAVRLEPRRLYTAREIEAATGIKAATIRADQNRDRWPAPDDTSSRAHRWTGATVNKVIADRRGYHRTESSTT
jgi:predicted DNA-binding transcriptional regulator AlpA